jgi:hypothetical protein
MEQAMTDHLTENARLRAALRTCINMLDDLVAESGRGIEYGEEDAFRMGEWFDDHDLMNVEAARAALATPAPDAPDLTDPTVVHANMLRGTIAKPTVAQIIHLYGSAVFLELLYKRGLCKPTVAPAPDAVQEAARVLLSLSNEAAQPALDACHGHYGQVAVKEFLRAIAGDRT